MSEILPSFEELLKRAEQKGRNDAIDELKDIICQRKCGECEWVTCPFEELKDQKV